MEVDYIILEWRVERRVKKDKVTGLTAERLAQMFGVSHAANYCNWADFFHVFSQGMYVTTMEELENTKTTKMFSIKAFNTLKPRVNDHLRKLPWPLFRMTVSEFSTVLNLR